MNFSNNTAKNLLDNGLSDLFDTGSIELRDGTQPTSADDAATGTLLATIILPNPCFAASVDDTPGALATAEMIGQVNGVDAGTTTWGRCFQSGGVTVIADLAVGTDIIISNPVISNGSPVDVTLFTLFQPESE